MKALSLFCGCGGFDLGLRALGVDVVYANDIMPESCETLSKYFPETDVHNEDIRGVTKFPNVDLVVGGYPCQSFSLAGNRMPSKDPRTYLFLEFARVVESIQPKYFIAENVSGMKGVDGGRWFDHQVKLFSSLGNGYHVKHKLINAQDYGVPQRRRRVFIVGVRKDLEQAFQFPSRTHCSAKDLVSFPHLKPFESHGEAIKHLPLDAPGEFYERPHDDAGHMSWYYMSRNRKAKWFEPSFCIVANFRHVTLHPACPTMELEWSNLADGFKQKWRFADSYEHLEIDSTLPKLDEPRRLTWRECAVIQTFPDNFEPSGNLAKKFEQIGNAVPPLLVVNVFKGLVDGNALSRAVWLENEFNLNKQPSLAFN